MTRKTLDEYLKQAQTTVNTTAKQQATKPKYRITGFYKETEFKETPIGKIPKEWRIVKLGLLFIFRNGKRPSRILENGIVPIYGANGIMGYTNTALLDRDYVIIIGRVGASGKVHLARGKIWVSDNAIYSESYDRNRINPIFAYFFLLFINLERYASKTTHPIIKQSFLKELEIPLPPLEEQWGVAEVLSTIDKAIEETERLIGRLERLKRGLMQELLTRGVGHREYKETPIGKIPKHWQVVKLGRLFTFKNGKRPSVVREHGQIPIYGAGFVQGYTDGFMVNEDNVIIIARVGKGSAGKVYIASGKMWISDNAIYAIPKNNLTYPVFYYYLLQFLRLDKIAVRSAAGGYSLITQSSLNNLYVPLPPYEEQKYIASTLSSIDEWIKLEKKRREKFERLKRGLMELLLTGRVRVRVERLDDVRSSSTSGGVAGL